MIWPNLQQEKQRLGQTSLAALVAQPGRFQQCSRQFGGILYDFSKQYIDASVLQALATVCNKAGLAEQMQAMQQGASINTSEGRSVGHMRLRALHPVPEVQQLWQQMQQFVQRVSLDPKIQHVINLGIGGSDLGPAMTCAALQGYRTLRSDVQLHFLSNLDPASIQATLAACDPATSICLVHSKSFTTVETICNAQLCQQWLQTAWGAAAVQQMYAITANVAAATAFGIPAAQIFPMWEWVGGRYSVWSAVGLPLALMLGFEQFQAFLRGARRMDEHFYSAPWLENLPVLMAMLGVWNINILGHTSLAIMPYLDGLQLLPAYLQQLEMESNGKSVNKAGQPITYATAPIIWGGVGCNGQHAYMQLLHQGQQIVPVDFFAATQLPAAAPYHGAQRLLLASCLAQSKALMEGVIDPRGAHASCAGNRPSSSILFARLDPETLGMLLAWYEHKVFVQGVLWQINSFDQWGVELGKRLATQLLPLLTVPQSAVGLKAELDASTAGLLAFINGVSRG